MRRELSVVVGSLSCAAMASCGGGVGFVGAFCKRCLFLRSFLGPRRSRAEFFASSVVSCPFPQSWDAQRGCIEQFVRVRPAEKTRADWDRICNSTEYDVQRGYQSNSPHASTLSDPTAVARKISAAENAFRPRTRRESAARCWKAARHGRTGLRTGADWSEPCGCELSSPAARQRRVGSAPRADRFSDSVRPRSAPG